MHSKTSPDAATTSDPDVTAQPPGDADLDERIEALVDADPAEAPSPAEALADELARLLKAGDR